MRVPRPTLLLAAALALSLSAGCSKVSGPPTVAAPHKHHHHPPHGGTPIELGEEDYHVELVLDAASGRLQAYVLDGEMENFVRSSAPKLEISATVAGKPAELALAAVANPETGETVGDTSLFECQADWLKTTGVFDAVLNEVVIRGTTYSNVKFNFPKGNDTDG